MNNDFIQTSEGFVVTCRCRLKNRVEGGDKSEEKKEAIHLSRGVEFHSFGWSAGFRIPRPLTYSGLPRSLKKHKTMNGSMVTGF